MDILNYKKQTQKEFIEYQDRKQKRLKKKKEQEKNYIDKLFNPLIKNNIVSWVDKNGDGKTYDGYVKGNLVFKIIRGIVSFSLKIAHKELKYDKAHSSTELIKLQIKANDIVQSNKDFLRKIKTIP